ncbi:MAG: CvpA family protein [Planctomycetales bacterium]|nr:CvpA family protein [Planctomycetales bacterium]
MNPYDIAVLALLVVFGAIGYVRGLSWQVVGILTILLCFTVAYPLSGMLEPTCARMLGIATVEAKAGAKGPPPDVESLYLARAAAWAAAFAVIWLFTHLLLFLFREAIEKWHLEELNRKLGLVLGLVKGALVVCAVTVILVTLGVEHGQTPSDVTRVPAVIAGSKAAPIVSKTVRVARFAFPDALGKGLSGYLDHVAGVPPSATKPEEKPPEKPPARAPKPKALPAKVPAPATATATPPATAGPPTTAAPPAPPATATTPTPPATSGSGAGGGR